MNKAERKARKVNSSHVREMRPRTMVEAARESKGGQKANERKRTRSAHQAAGAGAPLYTC